MDHPGRDTDHSAVGWHRLEYDGIRTDDNSASNLDAAEHLAPGTEQHIVADGGP